MGTVSSEMAREMRHPETEAEIANPEIAVGTAIQETATGLAAKAAARMKEDIPWARGRHWQMLL